MAHLQIIRRILLGESGHEIGFFPGVTALSRARVFRLNTLLRCPIPSPGLYIIRGYIPKRIVAAPSAAIRPDPSDLFGRVRREDGEPGVVRNKELEADRLASACKAHNRDGTCSKHAVA